MKHCIHCGGEIADDSKFCTWCGKEVATGAPAASVSSAPVVTPPLITRESFAGQNPIYGQTINTGQTVNGPTGTYPSSPQPYTPVANPQPVYPGTAAPKSDGLGIAALVFIVISAIANFINGFGYMALAANDSTYAGMAPLYFLLGAVAVVMAVLTWKKVKSKETITTGFKVLVLFFGSLISGILLFIRKEDQLR